MSVVIRQVKSKAKIAKLAQLDAKEFGADVCMFGSKTSLWWSAEVDGDIAGFATLTFYPERPDTAFLSRVFVCPKHRGMGLQKAFIRARERAARAAGVKRLITYTSYDNHSSANSLIAAGYRLYEPRYEWGVEHAYYFRKYL